MDFTQEQLDVINYPGTCFVMALAGSGKTTTISAKIKKIKKDNPAARVLYITFTRKAKAHGQKKLAGLVDVLVTNYHSLAYRILTNHKAQLQVGEIDIVSDSYCITILKAIHDAKNTEARKLYNRILKLKQDEIPMSEMGPEDFNLYKSFQDIMDDRKKFTYTDLIHRSNDLFAAGDLTPWMAQHLKFDYIFIDEQQDNYFGEFQLIENLASLSPNCVINGIGDLNQSIYGFAGARPTLCLQFIEKFNAKIFTLSSNFRSSKRIVEAGNAFLQNIREFQDHRPKMLSTRDDGEPIVWHSAARAENQYQYVCQEIANLHTTGYSYRDMYILYRSNKSGASFEKVATRCGIPFHLVQGSFLSRKTVKYLVDLIKFSDLYCSETPTDQDLYRSFKDLSKELEADIADKSWALLYQHESLTGLMGTLENIENMNVKGIGATRKRAFKKFHDDIITITDLYKEYLDDKDLLGYIGKLGDVIKEFKFAQKASQATFELIEEDMEIFATIMASLRGDLVSRINQFMIDYGSSDADKGGDKVNGMTVHKAKGLENKVVFFIDFDQMPPFWAKDADINEEGRIAYVGVTRAEERLYITSTGTRIPFWKPLQYLPLQTNVPSNIFEQLEYQSRGNY